MDYVVNLRGLSYQYPRAKDLNLNNIDLQVERGKLIAILGPTGAGKTTLCLCLNGLIPQFMGGTQSGEVDILGYNPRDIPVQEMAGHIGLVLQDSESQIIGNNVEDDTAFGPKNLGLPTELVQLRVKKALEMVGLAGYEKRNSRNLSGGEKQRLAIAGILAIDPEIIVLDEPTSELDPAGRGNVFSVIDDFRREKNLTTIVVEHNTEEIIARADEVFVVNNGEIQWSGLPRVLFGDIPLLNRLGIRPLPVSLLGWDLYQRGWIKKEEVPTDLNEAIKLLNKFKLNDKISLDNHQLMYGKAIQEHPIIKVSKLDFHYDNGIQALKSMDLNITKGEFIAIVGSNGGGKTTLVKHFNGLLKPSAGEVMVDGKNTKHFDVVQLSQIVGYVFQNPDHQIFSTTVEKEVKYGLENMGVPSSEINNRLNEILDLTGLYPYRNEHPLSLGKGIRQIIALASILVLKTKVLIIDEPTTGLDWKGIQTVMNLLKDLHKAGTTILMISHDMEVVSQYAQRVIVVDGGQIIANGPTREVLSNFTMLVKANVIPPQIARLSMELGLERCFLDEKELLEIIQLKVG